MSEALWDEPENPMTGRAVNLARRALDRVAFSFKEDLDRMRGAINVGGDVVKMRAMTTAYDSHVQVVLHLAEAARRLDEQCPTCAGPSRETVGMVCGDCGRDFNEEEES